MTVTCDSKRRVVLPIGKAGDHFDVEFFGDGRMIFTRLKPERKVDYIRKNGLLMAVTDTPVFWEETRRAMDGLP